MSEAEDTSGSGDRASESNSEAATEEHSGSSESYHTESLLEDIEKTHEVIVSNINEIFDKVDELKEFIAKLKDAVAEKGNNGVAEHIDELQSWATCLEHYLEYDCGGAGGAIDSLRKALEDQPAIKKTKV